MIRAHRVLVVLRGRSGEEMALSLDGSELGVPLNRDHRDECVADVLVWDLQGTLPLLPTLEITELDRVTGSVPVELDREVEVADPRWIEPDTVPPLGEIADPIIEGGGKVCSCLGLGSCP